jgi:hypothetical protein
VTKFASRVIFGRKLKDFGEDNYRTRYHEEGWGGLRRPRGRAGGQFLARRGGIREGSDWPGRSPRNRPGRHARPSSRRRLSFVCCDGIAAATVDGAVAGDCFLADFDIEILRAVMAASRRTTEAPPRRSRRRRI